MILHHRDMQLLIKGMQTHRSVFPFDIILSHSTQESDPHQKPKSCIIVP